MGIIYKLGTIADLTRLKYTIISLAEKHYFSALAKFFIGDQCPDPFLCRLPEPRGHDYLDHRLRLRPAAPALAKQGQPGTLAREESLSLFTHHKTNPLSKEMEFESKLPGPVNIYPKFLRQPLGILQIM